MSFLVMPLSGCQRLVLVLVLTLVKHRQSSPFSYWVFGSTARSTPRGRSRVREEMPIVVRLGLGIRVRDRVRVGVGVGVGVGEGVGVGAGSWRYLV